ncbi:MAG: UPF0280 family protein [Methanobrevibacter sp.]|uniref:UPF0280 family protein n=1 Tax=Methanobrevibacter sp. TaxID=66852 RepID=UPI0025D450AD|nr:UPF0280 family protein [Methanobrevibacter sp.]MBQ8017243.1 UPF0280 family protein [Methanobrevibacter sp.]
MEIDIGETHIRLKSDLENHNLKEYISSIRVDLKRYIAHNQDFLLSMDAIENEDDDLPLIIQKMYESSYLADVGPMACVAGTISELSLDYLIRHHSKNSIVENGGDIALINDRKILCGIYSNNQILGNNIAFEIKKRNHPLGICTSSGKIGHSISLGMSDSVTVLSHSPSIADGLATRIANEASGESGEVKVSNALECADNYREFFDGVLIICDDNVGTVGRLPKIVETSKFEFNQI